MRPIVSGIDVGSPTFAANRDAAAADTEAVRAKAGPADDEQQVANGLRSYFDRSLALVRCPPPVWRYPVVSLQP